MAAQSSINADAATTARAFNLTLSRIKASNDRLDADSKSTLCVSDLERALTLLQPVVDVSDSLRVARP